MEKKEQRNGEDVKKGCALDTLTIMYNNQHNNLINLVSLYEKYKVPLFHNTFVNFL